MLGCHGKCWSHVRLSWQMLITCQVVMENVGHILGCHGKCRSHVRLSWQMLVTCQVVMANVDHMLGCHGKCWSHIKLSQLMLVTCQVVMATVDHMLGCHGKCWSHVRLSWQMLVAYQVVIANERGRDLQIKFSYMESKGLKQTSSELGRSTGYYCSCQYRFGAYQQRRWMTELLQPTMSGSLKSLNQK